MRYYSYLDGYPATHRVDWRNERRIVTNGSMVTALVLGCYYGL